MGELDSLKPWVDNAHSILELGCGSGRLTNHLTSNKRIVTAVDNSPEMLCELPAGVRTICCDIEALDLGEQFDLVIAASYLVNSPDRVFRDKLFSNRQTPHGQ